MSGILGCFVCKRKLKKPVQPIPAVLSSAKSRISVLSTLKASSQSLVSEEAKYELMSQRRPRPRGVSNKPLVEYKFPRVKSEVEG